MLDQATPLWTINELTFLNRVTFKPQTLKYFIRN